MKNPYVWIMILMPFVALAGCRAAAPALPTSVEVRNTPPTSTQTPPPTATQAPPTPTFTVTPTRQPAPSPTSRPISDTVRITILYDNTSTAPELRAGWGFSALVEYHGHTVLFDAGADPTILKHNASQLNIDLAVIEAIVLSHIHQDHTGGLPAIDLDATRPTLYVLPSFPSAMKTQLARHTTVVEVEPGQELLEGLFTTGEIQTGYVPEQALVIRTGGGIVIITGCAHPGIAHIVSESKRLFGEPVRLVLGGFHLMNRSKAEVQDVIAALRDLGVASVAPAHCTGPEAIAAFAEAFDAGYVAAGAGQVIVVNPTDSP